MHVTCMRGARSAYRIFFVKSEWQRPLVRIRRRLEDIIQVNLKEIGYDGVYWIQLTQDRDRRWEIS